MACIAKDVERLYIYHVCVLGAEGVICRDKNRNGLRVPEEYGTLGEKGGRGAVLEGEWEGLKTMK